MLRSRPNTLVSVRQVTQRNAAPRPRDRRGGRIDLRSPADVAVQVYSSIRCQTQPRVATAPNPGDSAETPVYR